MGNERKKGEGLGFFCVCVLPCLFGNLCWGGGFGTKVSCYSQVVSKACFFLIVYFSANTVGNFSKAFREISKVCFAIFLFSFLQNTDFTRIQFVPKPPFVPTQVFIAYTHTIPKAFEQLTI